MGLKYYNILQINIWSFFLALIFFINVETYAAGNSDEITPYKYISDLPIPYYEIPASSRFITKRILSDAPDIVYYFTKPKTSSYSIIIMCGGSSAKDELISIIHFHRYFLKELNDLGLAVLTVEQWGIDGNVVNENEFFNHYTRSQRLEDHKTVIEHIKSNPPKGWNGKLVFLGVSEGGPIAIELTIFFSDITIATINWSSACNWSWREHLWIFLQDFPECLQHNKKNCDICLPPNCYDRGAFDATMNDTIKNPDAENYFAGMTYLYHADALNWQAIRYEKIITPLLVVTGTKDPIVQASDEFVLNAKKAGCSITYERVEGMDHYIKNRSDIIEKSFAWLKEQINFKCCISN